MRICLMIEGQEDVTWSDWVAIARACEAHGIETLFRSDHYVSVEGETGRGSLDAWATISALAAVTTTLRLGTLVSPVTFRHPSVLAKAAATADQVSGGRIEVGLGAGWHEPEHLAYGFPFPPTATRLEILREQLAIVHGQWSEDPFDFAGRHYRIEALRALPRPVQRPHPPIIVGGRAGPTSASLAGAWADEYNTVFATPETCARRRERVTRAWEAHGRDPATLRFSLMTGCVVGRDPDEVRARLAAIAADDDDVSAFTTANPGWIVGTVEEVVERLRALDAAGVDRVMLQHLAHRDLEMVALLGDEVAPAVA